MSRMQRDQYPGDTSEERLLQKCAEMARQAREAIADGDMEWAKTLTDEMYSMLQIWVMADDAKN